MQNFKDTIMKRWSSWSLV
ncbi:hypothetical protein RJ641_023721 [Dillenia turbinata]|uniref:Uncharacterized protein n=1 Tax=Dillenia turbinata TaxID=194707 RepID=A0AAN8YVX4_9MAGN